MSRKREYRTVQEAQEALRARGLHKAEEGDHLYKHSRLRPPTHPPFYIELTDDMNDRERGVMVDEALESLENTLEAMKEKP